MNNVFKPTHFSRMAFVMNTWWLHLESLLNRQLAAVAPKRRFGAPRRRKSSRNPQTGMSAPRSADFPACGFWRLSRCQRAVAAALVVVSLAGCGSRDEVRVQLQAYTPPKQDALRVEIR